MVQVGGSSIDSSCTGGRCTLDEPLRAYAEREINHHFPAHSVRIGTLDLQPFELSLDLEHITMTKKIALIGRSPPFQRYGAASSGAPCSLAASSPIR